MKIQKKRKMQGKTNYNKRLILLKGNTARLVVRKTNKYLIVQIVESLHAQDKVIDSVTTKDLLKQGWPKDKQGSLKSLSAGYLVGYLLGKKTKVEKVILDSGLIPSTKGSRVYAVVKGISDAGVNISHKKDVLPTEEKISSIEGFEKIKGGIK